MTNFISIFLRFWLPCGTPSHDPVGIAIMPGIKWSYSRPVCIERSLGGDLEVSLDGPTTDRSLQLRPCSGILDAVENDPGALTG